MGMDSVEIVLCWEESLGISVPDEEVSNVVTPGESVELLASLVTVYGQSGPCLSRRAFYKVRSILEEEFSIKRSLIKPSSRFSQLFPKQGRQKLWKQFKTSLGIKNLSTVGWSFFGPGSTTISDVICEIVARDAKSLIDIRHGWALNQLREVVRASVVLVVGKVEFSDQDHYIHDIGID